MKGFLCECGIFIPFGTPVERQIRHINGKYHKKRMKRWEWRQHGADKQ